MSGRAHLLIVLLTLSILGFLLGMVRRRQLRAKYAMLWYSLGAVLLVLAAFPSILDRVSVFLGISYGPATFFLGATALLFLISVHFSWELSRLEDHAHTLAEDVAFLRLELEELRREVDTRRTDGDPSV